MAIIRTERIVYGCDRCGAEGQASGHGPSCYPDDWIMIYVRNKANNTLLCQTCAEGLQLFLRPS